MGDPGPCWCHPRLSQAVCRTRWGRQEGSGQPQRWALSQAVCRHPMGQARGQRPAAEMGASYVPPTNQCCQRRADEAHIVKLDVDVLLLGGTFLLLCVLGLGLSRCDLPLQLPDEAQHVPADGRDGPTPDPL